MGRADTRKGEFEHTAYEHLPRSTNRHTQTPFLGEKAPFPKLFFNLRTLISVVKPDAASHCGPKAPYHTLVSVAPCSREWVLLLTLSNRAEEETMEFGDLIRAARARAGLSQGLLAQRLVTSKRPEGVWSTYIGQIEKGEKLPSEELCLKLAEVLELEPVEVLLAAYRDRADTPEAQRFFDALIGSANASALGELLVHEARDERTAVGVSQAMAEGLPMLFESPEWRELVGALSRMGRLGELPDLLAELSKLGEAEWEALDQFLRGSILPEDHSLSGTAGGVD